LRTTALPTARETMNPAFAGESLSAVPTYTMSSPRRARRPARSAHANSSRRRIRWPASSMTGSGREASAPLGATRGKYRAARAGAHAQPESVGLRAPTVVRLKSALAHVSMPSVRYLREAVPRGTRNPPVRRVTIQAYWLTVGCGKATACAGTPGSEPRTTASRGDPPMTAIPWPSGRLSPHGQRCYRARLRTLIGDAQVPTTIAIPDPPLIRSPR
jgi:hypothetical protein